MSSAEEAIDLLNDIGTCDDKLYKEIVQILIDWRALHMKHYRKLYRTMHRFARKRYLQDDFEQRVIWLIKNAQPTFSIIYDPVPALLEVCEQFLDAHKISNPHVDRYLQLFYRIYDDEPMD